MISVAIDGPSGSGKSTVSKYLAKKFNFLNVDTGALYRAVAYFFVSNGLSFQEESEVKDNLHKIKIDLKYYSSFQVILLNGEDITDKLRSNDISMAASYISAMPVVRDFLLELQRNLSTKSNVIMDGRDIGTVVLPDATVKIFLTASPHVRAKRRFEQLNKVGGQVDYEETMKKLNERDFNDIHRKVSPLKAACDAIVLDSSEYTFEQTVSILSDVIKECMNCEAE